MQAELEKKLRFIYQGGRLKRFHARDTLLSQNISEHSALVAWLVALQYEATPPAHVLLAALSHDLGEFVAGDVPGDTKAKNPELRRVIEDIEDKALVENGFTYCHSLTEEESKIVQFADCMEGLMFCIRERRMGSRACDDIWFNYMTKINALRPYPNDRTMWLVCIMNKLYTEAKQ